MLFPDDSSVLHSIDDVHDISDPFLVAGHRRFCTRTQANLFHLDHTGDPGKESMVLSDPNVVPGPEFLSPLPYQDGPGLGGLVVEDLDAEPPTDRIPTVVRRSTGFFCGHPPNSRYGCGVRGLLLWLEGLRHRPRPRGRTVRERSDHVISDSRLFLFLLWTCVVECRDRSWIE